MNLQLDGRAFVALVSTTVGRKLNFAEWVAALYDASRKTTVSSPFQDLAFTAKSLQKLTRLLSTGISDENAKRKVVAELQDAIKKFSVLLEGVSEGLKTDEKEKFAEEFLTPSASSFEKLKTLLDDFALVKDFYLMRRDDRGGL